MATIKELTYLLWRNLEGGNIPDDTRFKEGEMYTYMSDAVARVMREKYFEDRNISENKYPENGKTSVKEIKRDRDTQYIELTDKSIDLGGVRKYQITQRNPFSRWVVEFAGVDEEEVFNYNKMPKIPNIILYTLKDNKIYFYNGVVQDEEVTLTQYYVLPNDIDDDYDLPKDVGNRAMAYALQMAQAEIKPIDREIDGTPINYRTNG